MTSSTPPPLVAEDYRVGIICALHIELAAVKAMLDEEHPTLVDRDINDGNTYSLGRLHQHNVVIACLPSGIDGLVTAANVAKDIRRTFSQLRFGLLVGIGGGIPDLEAGRDIRLGDVVVSRPTGTSGGVVQYDKFKAQVDNKFERKGTLNAPPTILLTAVQTLQAKHDMEDSAMPEYINAMFVKYPKMKRRGYVSPGRAKDMLHKTDLYANCRKNGDGESCDEVVERLPRYDDGPEVHYGTIASGNQVVKSAVVRDLLRHSCDALCVEMEAAGLMNEFPCLVIRGICDYADAYKNDEWHGYAAVVAAAYAKELLAYISPEQTSRVKPMQEISGLLSKQHQEVLQQHAQQRHFNTRQEQRQEDSILSSCHQAFKTSDYETAKEVNPLREPGTCEWVLSHPKYQRWLNNEQNDLLWISADPGCGKSVLSRTLVDEILRSEDTTKDVAICYYFFKENEDQGKLCAALCALLHQLFTQRPHLVQVALPTWNLVGEKIQQEPNSLWRIFQDACTHKDAGSVICILDALDECIDSDRRHLMTKLKIFYQNQVGLQPAAGTWKFIITSRPYTNIEDGFRTLVSSLPSIHLRGEDEDQQIRDEIDLVVRSRVRQLNLDPPLPEEVKARIENKLRQIPHRTYLWLHLAMDNIPTIIRNSMNPGLETFDSIPTTVDAAYESILSKIDDSLKPRVRKILTIVLGAPRPLTIGEMAIALGFAAETRTPRSLSDLTVDAEHLGISLRQWCGLFIFINDNKLHLIHQTAKEFLLSNLETVVLRTDCWQHSIPQFEVDKEMAEIYIHYLCLDDFDAVLGELLDAELENAARQDLAAETQNLATGLDATEWTVHSVTVRHQVTFFYLAVSSWARHWQRVEDSAGRNMKRELDMLYDSTSLRWTRWTRGVKAYSGGTSLHLAILNRHCGIIQELVATKHPDLLESKDYLGWTPLMVAASEGYVEAIRLLIDAGADPNMKRINHYSVKARFAPPIDALQLAITNKHEQAAQLLLERGADVNSRNSRETVLMLACAKNLKHSVRLLIENGANVEIRDGEGPALRVAATAAHNDVIELLIELGASVDTVGDEFGTALYAAAANGQLTTVRYLVEKGANLDIPSPEGETPLMIALENNHQDIAKYLIERGANVNYRCEQPFEALEHSSGLISRFKIPPVRQHKYDGEHFGPRRIGRFNNALQIAAAQGEPEMVRLLVSFGADVNASGGAYGSALNAAVHANAPPWLYRVMLASMANPNAHGYIYGTPLCGALSRLNITMLRLLKEHGAWLDAPDDHGNTVLIRAAFWGQSALVTMLLKYGANPEIRNSDGIDARMAALKGAAIHKLDYLELGSRTPLQYRLIIEALFSTSAQIHKNMDDTVIQRHLQGHISFAATMKALRYTSV